MSAADRKTYWDLLETVRWICTRDEEEVAAMWDMKEEQKIPLAMFSAKAEFDPRSLLILRKGGFEADREGTTPEATRKSPEIDGSNMMGPGQALDDVLRKVRLIRMTAIKCGGCCDEQVLVPPAELNDLEFRLAPGHRVAQVGLWSRSRNTLRWRSPQFLRTDVIRVWPARNKKTAAVSSAILRHLRTITTPEAPLTKADAQRRCLAVIPNAYPEAFKKAWAALDPSCKRGRGKHGPRAR